MPASSQPLSHSIILPTAQDIAEVTDAPVVDRSGWTLEEAFPNIDPGVQPFGSRVLVQLRTPKTRTKGGILIADETKETEYWNTQVGKVLALGPGAFKSREKGETWWEGEWCQPGDFVRTPLHNGDRIKVQIDANDKTAGFALFVIFEDLHIIGRITGDPLSIIAYV